MGFVPWRVERPSAAASHSQGIGGGEVCSFFPRQEAPAPSTFARLMPTQYSCKEFTLAIFLQFNVNLYKPTKVMQNGSRVTDGGSDTQRLG